MILKNIRILPFDISLDTTVEKYRSGSKRKSTHEFSFSKRDKVRWKGRNRCESTTSLSSASGRTAFAERLDFLLGPLLLSSRWTVTPIVALTVQVKQEKIQTQYSVRLDFLFFFFFFFPIATRVTFLSLLEQRGESANHWAGNSGCETKLCISGGVLSRWKVSSEWKRAKDAQAAAALLQAAGIFETRELERNSGDLCCENIGGYCWFRPRIEGWCVLFPSGGKLDD